MSYLKGSEQNCLAYDELVSQGEGFPNGKGTFRWMKPIERNGDYYIRKHPDYEPTSGLTEAELPPEPEGIDEI